MKDLLSKCVQICPGMVLLPGFADSWELAADLQGVIAQAPLRTMQTARGFAMSVMNSNCGAVGWISDRGGYRYSATDPETGLAWPAMPESFAAIANAASIESGFGAFAPDACLINRYQPGTQMGAHQDRDEADFSAPIVSVSLGLDARFFVLGPERSGPSTPVDLTDGDVLVFGGPARKHFHGVRKLKAAEHPQFGAVRWNLTFRKAM